MVDFLLSPLVSSDTRVRLLLRFFANPGRTAYLRALAGEYDLSPNAVREELSRLSQAKLLTSFKNGREIHIPGQYRAPALRRAGEHGQEGPVRRQGGGQHHQEGPSPDLVDTLLSGHFDDFIFRRGYEA